MNDRIRRGLGQALTSDERGSPSAQPPQDGGAREFSSPRRAPTMSDWLRGAAATARAEGRQTGLIFTGNPKTVRLRGRRQEEER